jgi:HlyD family secretion protein
MKLNKKATKTIITVVVLLVAVGAAARYFTKPKKTGTVVTLAKAVKKDLVISTSITGNIKANDEDVKYLQVSQKVTDVYVTEGQEVKAGDVLAKQDTSTLEYNLKKAQLNYDSTKLSANSTYNQAQVNYENAVNAYNEALRKYNSDESLYASSYISQDELSTAKKTLTDAENQAKLYKLQMDNSDVNSTSSNQQKQLASIQADIENYTKQIKDSTYVSNINGKVVKVDVKKDEIPQTGENTIVIDDTSVYKVSFDITQNDALDIKLGQDADVKLKGSDKTYKGKVTKIGQAASVVSNGTSNESKINIDVTISNPDENIKVGYEADATIYLQTKKDVISASFDSVKQDASGKKYVFVIENNKTVKKYVETGLETDFEVEIRSGLKEGESYISSPPDTLKENDAVTTQAAGGKKK